VPSLLGGIASAIRGAIGAVLRLQGTDGFWRDFKVPIGQSEAWTTALVAWCLTPWVAQRRVCAALSLARDAILAAHRPGGWGFHRKTRVDADSTAWVLRYLAVVSPAAGVAATKELLNFVDAGGHGHTFLESGDWGRAHQDVTPVVGLALLANRASPFLVGLVRKAVLEDISNTAPKRAYWWESRTYPIALQLRFLFHTGGIPDHVKRVAAEALRTPQNDPNQFEFAHELVALVALGDFRGRADDLVEALLATQRTTGLWEGCAPLLVPAAEPSAPIHLRGPYRDSGIVTTAIALSALHSWASGRIATTNGTCSLGGYLSTQRLTDLLGLPYCAVR
jgi:hypothetical protein